MPGVLARQHRAGLLDASTKNRRRAIRYRTATVRERPSV
jgi:hypothetical protein